jgi:uncharacterized integral membrane protein
LKIKNILFGLPIALFVIIFAVSNREMVEVSLFPFPFEAKTSLSILILSGAGISFILGGFFAWFNSSSTRIELKKVRKELKKQKKENKSKEEELKNLKSKLKEEDGESLSFVSKMKKTKII